MYYKIIDIFFIALICCNLSSCATWKLKNTSNSTNIKKLSRVYFIEQGDKKIEFESKQAWLDYCDTQYPRGYSVLKQGNELFTGTAVRFYKKKGIFSKPQGYSLFSYKNGFIDGAYSYHFVNGNTLIEGVAGVDTTKNNSLSSPLLNGGLYTRELGSNRKEYVIREKIYNKSGRVISFYVKDSVDLIISEFHSSTTDTWEKIHYREDGKVEYYLNTARNGDTLYYSYNSDSVIIIDAKEKYKPDYPFYVHERKSFCSYTDSFRWLESDGFKYKKNNTSTIVTTISGDTIEKINWHNGKYDGILLKFNVKGDTIEKIPFKNGKLDGVWIRRNIVGDTIFYKTFLEGKAHGKSFSRGGYTFVEENYANDFLNGKVLIYQIQSGNKYLVEEFSMKNDLKDGKHIRYTEFNSLNTDIYIRRIREITEYFNGMRHGEYKDFGFEGIDLHAEGIYQYDKSNGIWKYYDKIYGNTFYEYLNGVVIKRTKYNPDGTIKSED